MHKMVQRANRNPVMIKGYWQTGRVYIDGEELAPQRSQELRSHSPCGFAWGYGGSGPGQLALALLLHFSNDEEFSLRFYQTFKWDVVSKIHYNFELDESRVTDWIESVKKGERKNA